MHHRSRTSAALLFAMTMLVLAACSSTTPTSTGTTSTTSTPTTTSTVRTSTSTGAPPPGTAPSSTSSSAATKLDSDELKSIITSKMADASAASKITLVTINEASSPAVVVIGYVDDKNTGVDVCRAADSYVFSRRPDATIEVDLTGGDTAATTSKPGYCAQA